MIKTGMPERAVSRRGLLQTSGVAALAGALTALELAGCAQSHAEGGGAGTIGPENQPPIPLPKLFAPTEREPGVAPDPWPPEKRVRFAIVGLGRLSLDQILPAFGASKKARVTALVSGDRGKATRVAAQYGVKSERIYDYAGYDHLRDAGDVDVVYVVLPNGMHAEYTTRAFQAGKHVLCEKPMANTVSEAEQMIDAGKKAGKRLMIAYRMQYEPYHRAIIRLARAGDIGRLKSFVATNAQVQGDPAQWRLKKALAGGGALPDVGIYCLNAARYLTGEEPLEISAMQHTTAGDPRFAEVEEQVNFQLRFPSGLLASCMTSYAAHDSRAFRLLGEKGWVSLDPAFSYTGQKLRLARKRDGTEEESIEHREIEPKNQFALELDHFAQRIVDGMAPLTPGEEGLQDMKLMAAIYEAARTGTPVKLAPVPGLDAFRGPPIEG